MAGGLFGRPFVLNIKCIVFSLICMALFLYKPVSSSGWVLYSTLFIIFVISYVALAWYDYYYDCRVGPLKRGKISFTGLFKPPPHMPERQTNGKSSPIDRNRKMLLIAASHVLLVVPLLLYIAYARRRVNPLVYPLLAALAAFTLLYHGLNLLSAVH